MEKYPRLGWPEEAQTLFQYHEIMLPWLPQSSSSSSFNPVGYGYLSSSSEAMEDKSGIASKSHSQAEKRRRERINGHLSTLRRLIPRSEKMDKAALLGSVVSYVRELKRRAAEAGKLATIPTDVDEVCVDYDDMSKDDTSVVLKATVCCEDRPDLFSDLIQALKGVEVRAVKVEMATLGGRCINVMLLCCSNNESVCLSSLKQSVKAVLSRVASLSMPSVSDFSSKRRRMMLSSNYSNSSSVSDF